MKDAKLVVRALRGFSVPDDHVVEKNAQNDKIAGSGQVEHAKEAARSRRSKQLPAKHQVAENTLRQKQEQAHPDLPRTVDFVVFAYDF